MTLQNAQSAFGVLTLLLLAWAFGERRGQASVRQAAAALALTAALALLLLKVPGMREAFALANRAVEQVAAATRAGTSFVFGYLGGGPLPFQPESAGSAFVLAFQALPIVLVVSVLTTVLFYWGVLPRLVRVCSWALQRTLGVGGAVGISTAANIFVGMVEAPLFIRPYLASLTRSELFVVMTGGMAGIAGTVFALYAAFLTPLIPGAAGHIIVASILGAPAAILVARIMVPETASIPNRSELPPFRSEATGTMDAVVRGTVAGLELLLTICAMLIVLLALVHLVNAALALLPDVTGAPISLERLFGVAMAPVCWLLGLSWSEALVGGELMGLKTVLNEFVAYARLAALDPSVLSERSRIIMLYALCGFANFGSLGIMIGGLSTMAPERRSEIIELGGRSIISGTLSTCVIAAIVGVLM